MSKSKESHRRKRDSLSSPEFSSTCPTCKAPICACTEYVPLVEGAEFSPLAQDRNDPSPRPHKRQKNAEGAAMKRDAASSDGLPIVDLDSDSENYEPRKEALANQNKCNPDDGYTCLICATVHGVPTDATVICTGCKETVCDTCFKQHIATNRSRDCCKEFMCCHSKKRREENPPKIYKCALCPNAKNELSSACETCKKDICDNCFNTHRTVNIFPVCCPAVRCCHSEDERKAARRAAKQDQSCYFCKQSGAAACTHPRDENGHYICSECKHAGMAFWMIDCTKVCHQFLCEPCHEKRLTVNPRPNPLCCKEDFCCHPQSLRDELAKKAKLDAATATISRTCALCSNRAVGLTAACHICNRQLCDPCFMAHTTLNTDRRCCDGEYCCHSRSQENKGAAQDDDSDNEDHAPWCKTDECEVCEECDQSACLQPGAECDVCGGYICEDCLAKHTRSCK